MLWVVIFAFTFLLVFAYWVQLNYRGGISGSPLLSNAIPLLGHLHLLGLSAKSFIPQLVSYSHKCAAKQQDLVTIYFATKPVLLLTRPELCRQLFACERWRGEGVNWALDVV